MEEIRFQWTFCALPMKSGGFLRKEEPGIGKRRFHLLSCGHVALTLSCPGPYVYVQVTLRYHSSGAGSYWLGAHAFGQASKLQVCTVSAFPALGLSAPPHADLSWGSWGLNPGLHACKASHFLTELYPKLHAPRPSWTQELM